MSLYPNPKTVIVHNGEQFIKDFRAYRPYAYTKATSDFFKIRKLDIWETAQRKQIKYYLTDKIFRNGRTVLVVC